jgi:hypothetical protein
VQWRRGSRFIQNQAERHRNKQGFRARNSGQVDKSSFWNIIFSASGNCGPNVRQPASESPFRWPKMLALENRSINAELLGDFDVCCMIEVYEKACRTRRFHDSPR